jgi:hypothetical protein
MDDPVVSGVYVASPVLAKQIPAKPTAMSETLTSRRVSFLFMMETVLKPYLNGW